MKSILSVICAALFFVSCTKTENQNNAGEAKVNISEMNQKFIAAWNNRQQDSLIAWMADDMHFLQGDVHYNGKSQVADNWVRKTIGTINNLRTNPVSSGAGDNIAYEAGTFTVDVPAKQTGEPNAEGKGNYMLLWKKQDNGKWRLSYAQLEDHPLTVK